MLADSYKSVEELVYKEDASCGVSEWAFLCIPEGVILENNLGNDEYISFWKSKYPAEVI